MTGFTSGRENGSHRRPRGYADWRPQRKTQVILDQVAAVLDEYADYLPLTVRQIFYRLVGAYGYEKTERAYARLCEYLVRARRAGSSTSTTSVTTESRSSPSGGLRIPLTSGITRPARCGATSATSNPASGTTSRCGARPRA